MSILIGDTRNAIDQNIVYKDLDINNSKKEFTITNFNAIRSSIRNHLTIKKGSRILNPNMGSDLDKYLFEQLNDTNAGFLGEDIDAILRKEPRISVLDVIVSVDKENSQYIVDIVFTIPTISDNSIQMQLSVNRDDGVLINSEKIGN